MIADLVEQRPAHVHQQGAFVSRIEVLDALQRLDQRDLHDVVRIHEIARGGREAAGGPSLQHGQEPPGQAVAGAGVAAPDQMQQ